MILILNSITWLGLSLNGVTGTLMVSKVCCDNCTERAGKSKRGC